MKKFKKARINEFVEMTDREMRFTVGGSGSDSGSGSGSGSGQCCYSTTLNGSLSSCSGADDCDTKAGKNGWWCCNTSSCVC